MEAKVKKALEFAKEKHKGQFRKVTNAPYFTHPMMVCDLLVGLGADEDVQCAALLHDVVEDTDVTFDEIGKLFGFRVKELVGEVTKDKDGNFNIRSREGLMIKLADTLHNMSDCIWDGYVQRKIQWFHDTEYMHEGM